MIRTHLIMPMLPKPPAPTEMDKQRAIFAGILIGMLEKDPKPELMDKIEMVLWGRTFGSDHAAQPSSKESK